MAVAAFVVSVVAVIVALGSLVYARQTATINRARRHDERTPRLSFRPVPIRAEQRGWPSFEISLDGPEDLDDVVVHLLPPRVDEVAMGALFDTGDGSRVDQLRLGRLEVGGAAVLRVHLDEDTRRGTLARLVADCRRGRERWRVPGEVNFPRAPRVSSAVGLRLPRESEIRRKR